VRSNARRSPASCRATRSRSMSRRARRRPPPRRRRRETTKPA